MQIIWLGHSGFRIEIEGAVLLVDPWISGNPMFSAERREEAIHGATHVLLTHGHGDHSADAAAICRELGIPLVGIYDLVAYLEGRAGISSIGYNKGGTVDVGGARATLVNACHSSSAAGPEGAVAVGSEAGYMIAGEGHIHHKQFANATAYNSQISGGIAQSLQEEGVILLDPDGRDLWRCGDAGILHRHQSRAVSVREQQLEVLVLLLQEIGEVVLPDLGR
jgi:L-ascorbate metabolism protein UlaG (beta-lactamase superfamily)